jgi:hypothetical protein
MDEVVRLRMRRAHAKYHFDCDCGKRVWGNGGKAGHVYWCLTYQRARAAACRSLLEDAPGGWSRSSSLWADRLAQAQERIVALEARSNPNKGRYEAEK